MVKIQKWKKKSVAKFIHIKEGLGLYDIWRIRNPKKNVIHLDNSMSPVSFKEG